MRNEELAQQVGRRTDQLRIVGRGQTAGELALGAGLTAEFIRRVLGGEHDVRISTLLKIGRALGLEVRRTKRDPKTGKLLEPQCVCAMLEPPEQLPIGIRAGLGSLALDRVYAMESKETNDAQR